MRRIRPPAAARCFTNELADYGERSKARRKGKEGGGGDHDGKSEPVATDEAGAGVDGAGSGSGGEDGKGEDSEDELPPRGRFQPKRKKWPPVPMACSTAGPPSGEAAKPATDEALLDEADHIAEVIKLSWPVEGDIRRPFLYTGAGGAAYMLFRMYVGSEEPKYLEEAVEYLEKCTRAAGAGHRFQVSFLLGPFGLWALLAVCHHLLGNAEGAAAAVEGFKRLFHQEMIDGEGISRPPLDMPDVCDELMTGRAGFLYAAQFLNHHLGDDTFHLTDARPIVDALFESGRKGKVMYCPLSWNWRGKWYTGAAHGTAGVLSVLMRYELTEEEEEDVEATLLYYVNRRHASNNFPIVRGEGKSDRADRLVHWCHGATGWVMVLCQAYKRFGNEEFLTAAVEAADVVWQRGLLLRSSLCHGVAGNLYAFLALYRTTEKAKHLHRAMMFASFLLGRETLAEKFILPEPDHPLSLFEGLAGIAVALYDVVYYDTASFPGFEL